MIMKILAFSDVHTDLSACQNLVAQSRGVSIDVVIGAGDFATMRRGLQPVIDCLGEITQPIILVPGNGESWEELQAATRPYPQIHVLHGQGLTCGGVEFFGLGYAVPETPFGAWSCDLSEATAADLLEACPADCVLVTHSPPYGHVDQNRLGEHVGSQAIKDIMQRRHPRMVLCGHVHDCWQQTSCLGECSIYNLGPGGTLIDLPT
jgi:Icc-related predicted phosphoesterase